MTEQPITAYDRARRLLSLVHEFTPGTTVPLSDLAMRLGLSVAELESDLETLSCCGVAPYSPDALMPLYIEDGDLVVWGPPPALSRPVRLSANEARALVTALETALGTSAEKTPLVMRLREVAMAAEPDAEELVRTIRMGASTTGPAALATVARALDERRAVHVSYLSAGEEEPRDRILEPFALLYERHTWYVEAFCRRVREPRTFRVDRIQRAVLLDEPATFESGAPAASAIPSHHENTALIALDDGEGFSARIWPGARMVTSPESDPRVRVEVPYADPGWIARQVVARGGRAEVLAPESLRRAVAELALEECGRLAQGPCV